MEVGVMAGVKVEGEVEARARVEVEARARARARAHPFISSLMLTICTRSSTE